VDVAEFWNPTGLTGGLTVLGFHPDGWRLPASAVVTIPPIELAECRWSAPPLHGSWAFVTENPSVLTAARGLALAGAHPLILCTSGTPSRLETRAIARLTDAGWNLAVRADFDAAGLRHVEALIHAAPQAVPWRMDTEDYLEALDKNSTDTPADASLVTSSWNPDLALTMQMTGSWAYEESLISLLLEDLRRGAPNDDAGSQQK
jgi:hypothetical protein